MSRHLTIEDENRKPPHCILRKDREREREREKKWQFSHIVAEDMIKCWKQGLS